MSISKTAGHCWSLRAQPFQIANTEAIAWIIDFQTLLNLSLSLLACQATRRYGRFEEEIQTAMASITETQTLSATKRMSNRSNELIARRLDASGMVQRADINALDQLLHGADFHLLAAFFSTTLLFPFTGLRLAGKRGLLSDTSL